MRDSYERSNSINYNPNRTGIELLKLNSILCQMIQCSSLKWAGYNWDSNYMSTNASFKMSGNSFHKKTAQPKHIFMNHEYVTDLTGTRKRKNWWMQM